MSGRLIRVRPREEREEGVRTSAAVMVASATCCVSRESQTPLHERGRVIRKGGGRGVKGGHMDTRGDDHCMHRKALLGRFVLEQLGGNSIQSTITYNARSWETNQRRLLL